MKDQNSRLIHPDPVPRSRRHLLYAEWDAEKRNWNAAAEMSGSVGLGMAVPGVAGGACYPGSVKLKLDARRFIAHEIMYRRVEALLRQRTR